MRVSEKEKEELSFEEWRTELTLQALKDTDTVGSSLFLLFATPPGVYLTEPLTAVLAHLGTKAGSGAFLPESLSLAFLEDFLGRTGLEIRHVLVLDKGAPYAGECTDGMQETESGKVGVVWGVVEGGHKGGSVEEARGMGVRDEKGLDEVTKEVGGGKARRPIVVDEASGTDVA